MDKSRLESRSRLDKLIPAHTLLKMMDAAGYDGNKAHPAAYKDFSYLKFTELLADYFASDDPDEFRYGSGVTENVPVSEIKGNAPRSEKLTLTEADALKNAEESRQRLAARSSELARLREFQSKIEEAEARCCPEDVGFEEWIGVLKRQGGERDVQIGTLTAAINAMNQAPNSATSPTNTDAQEAARYRFLRDGEPNTTFITSKEERGRLVADSDVDLDKYIDEILREAEGRDA